MSDNQAGTTLVIMAAGIGSRFGEGIKQLSSFGPGGEIIMDYSIYDAIHAGFDRIVFVIRKDLEKDFREVIGNRIEKHAEVAYAFQEREDLPAGYKLPESRKKPWGTGQAVLATRELIRGPFCVINADDYYGKTAFRLIHDYLTEGVDMKKDLLPIKACMTGFVLKNTLSAHGGVTRGVCSLDMDGCLTEVHETKNIIAHAGGAAVMCEGGSLKVLNPESLVSMNMWGFFPDFFDVLETGFRQFLKEHLGTGDENTAEFLLPAIVDAMLRSRDLTVDVLRTADKWFGVTYQKDIPSVKENFNRLVRAGQYPEGLWG